jgi:zinc protease
MVLGVPLRSEAQSVPKIKYEKYTLPNGLEVILHEDHSTPIVAVNTWYHVGSGDEKPGRTGFAHLFEHIMFMGSEHVPVGVFDKELEAAGGDNNGSTTEDRTNLLRGRAVKCSPAGTVARLRSHGFPATDDGSPEGRLAA